MLIRIKSYYDLIIVKAKIKIQNQAKHHLSCNTQIVTSKIQTPPSVSGGTVK